MLILIDEDIPHAGLFNSFGQVRTFAGRALNDPASDSRLLADLAAADALVIRSVTRIDSALLNCCLRLKFLGTVTTGLDHIDAAAVQNRGITLADAAGANALPVAEYVVAALTILTRSISSASPPTIAGAPRPIGPSEPTGSSGPIGSSAHESGLPLAGKTLGIIGRGRIGSIVSAWAAQLGMTILACDPPLARQSVAGLVPFDELADAADIITLHVPLTRTGPDATAGMVNAAWLSKLRPGAMLINTSRGEVVDESALCDALDAGRLSAVAIDVWRDEPAVSRRLVAAAALSTSHFAGYSVESRRRAAVMIRDALAAWQNSPAKSGISAPSEPGCVSPVNPSNVPSALNAPANPPALTGSTRAGSENSDVSTSPPSDVSTFRRFDFSTFPPAPSPDHINTLVALLQAWSARFKQAAAIGEPAAAFDALRREAQSRKEAPAHREAQASGEAPAHGKA